MVDYAPALKKLLRENGCWFDRQGKGDHDDLVQPHTNRKFPVDSKIKSRNTADGVLKQAGLTKAS
jgi:hypothetical protein